MKGEFSHHLIDFFFFLSLLRSILSLTLLEAVVVVVVVAVGWCRPLEPADQKFFDATTAVSSVIWT
jgi:hypothetical protein